MVTRRCAACNLNVDAPCRTEPSEPLTGRFRDMRLTWTTRHPHDAARAESEGGRA